MFQVSQYQLMILLIYSALVGAALGLVYDIFRIFRVAFIAQQHPKEQPRKVNKNSNFFVWAIIFVQDIAFWLIAAVVTILFIFMVNRGQVRLFALSGQVMGFIIYFFTVGRVVYKFSEQIVLFIKSAIDWANKAVIIPVCKFIIKLYMGLYIKAYHRYLVGYTKRQCTKIKLSAAKGFKIV